MYRLQVIGFYYDDAALTLLNNLSVCVSLPQVEVRDFVEVMCLSQGITKETLSAHINPPVADETGAVKNRELTATPGIVPPRREIGELRVVLCGYMQKHPILRASEERTEHPQSTSHTAYCSSSNYAMICHVFHAPLIPMEPSWHDDVSISLAFSPSHHGLSSPQHSLSPLFI